jgi:hypothetical protein
MKRLKALLIFMARQLRRSLERFPVTAAFALGFVVTAIYQNHYDTVVPGRATVSVPDRLMLVMALGVFLSAATKMAIERFEVRGPFRDIILALSVLASFLYYLTVPDVLRDYFMMRYFALIGMLFALFCMLPYTRHREGLSRYVLHLVGKFFITVLYSGVIYFGFWMILFSIENLFGINWPSDIYFDVFIAVVGLFSVTYFLGNVPEMHVDLAVESYSKVFKTLFLYIVLPIASIYTVILYAYFIKLLFERSLPEGLLGNLIIWYALISTVTLYFLRDLRGGVSWLHRFMQIFIPLMVVPMGMLFLAIGIRIGAYGWTMPRYFVVLLGVFMVASLLLMRLKKGDSAVWVTALAIILVGIGFYGPISGYQATLNDQTARLETMLSENGMLDAQGNLVARTDLSKDVRSVISNQVAFLLEVYDPAQIKLLPDDFSQEQSKAVLGFDIYENRNPWPDRYVSYYKEVPRTHMDISTYDDLLVINSNSVFEEEPLNGGYTVSKTFDGQVLEIKKDGALIYALDLAAAAARFYEDPSVTPVYEAEGMKLLLDFYAIDGDLGLSGGASVTDINYYDLWLLIDFYD